jgi:hypothetical protein
MKTPGLRIVKKFLYPAKNFDVLGASVNHVAEKNYAGFAVSHVVQKVCEKVEPSVYVAHDDYVARTDLWVE